jgi:multidrug efflux system membrane fusion protein
VQRGPIGAFVYVIGADNIAKAKPITVTLQTETDAVIAKGLTVDDRVVTTGFANLADGAKVSVGQESTPEQDLAPRKREHRRGRR